MVLIVVCAAPDCANEVVGRRSDALYCQTKCKHRAARAANPEKFRARDECRRSDRKAYTSEYGKSYRAQNRERKQAYLAEWRRNNREQYLASQARWQREHPNMVRLIANNRRARKLNAPTFVFTERDWKRLVARFYGCCAYCLVKCDNLQLDHVIPLSRGGYNGAGNYLPACPTCNRSKGARLLFEWKKKARGV